MQFNKNLEHISRREFLKLSGFGLLGLLIAPLRAKKSSRVVKYGRVMDEQIGAHSEPDFNSPIVEQYSLDTILPVQNTIAATMPTHNPDWFQINANQFIHSSHLQPVAIKLNEAQKVAAWGQLAEVTIPYTDAYLHPTTNSKIAYRYYYQTTHWVDALKIDHEDNAWYRVRDDLSIGKKYYVRAEHLYVLPKYETDPISPDLPLNEKRIEVHADQQLVVAYEGDRAVFISKVATGDQATNELWKTPLGEFKTYYKRPSRHMAAGNRAFGDYDLPGVPWVSFITEYGIAFHGTYWHNDFGRPRSHGCINLPSRGAKWLYRWTMPNVPYDKELKYIKDVGTKVEII